MHDFWTFAGEHYIVLLFIVWSAATVLKSPFWALNRYFRSRNIAQHGWPTAPMDADGDIVYPDKD